MYKPGTRLLIFFRQSKAYGRYFRIKFNVGPRLSGCGNSSVIYASQPASRYFINVDWITFQPILVPFVVFTTFQP